MAAPTPTPTRTEQRPMTAVDPLAGIGLVALVATSAFRLGVLPGGLLGVELALALAGWWLALPAADGAERRAKLGQGWRRWWTGLFAAVALAIAWVLVADPTRWDDTVRGEALAGFGSYANWHQIARGPLESLATRNQSPLQHLWAVALLVQCTAVWWVASTLARRRAERREGAADPSAGIFGVLGLLAYLGGVAMLASGASGQVLLMATVPGATAFLLGAAVGAADGTPIGAAIGEGAAYLRWVAVGLLAATAVLAGPQTDLGRVLGATVVPLAVVVVVAAWARRPAAAAEGRTGPAPVGDEADDEAGAAPARHGRGTWSVLVAVWFLLTPMVAVCRAAWPGGAVVLVDVAGTMLAVAAALVLAASVERLSDDERAVERRRVLVPPAAVALLVLLGSVTGAFHWESPQPRDQWPRPATADVPTRPGPSAPRP